MMAVPEAAGVGPSAGCCGRLPALPAWLWLRTTHSGECLCLSALTHRGGSSFCDAGCWEIRSYSLFSSSSTYTVRTT